MEPDDEFERRAFSAAGPVFLVALGVVLLLVLGVGTLVGGFPPDVAMLLLAVGAGSIVAAVVWAAGQRKAPPHHARP